MARLSVSLLGAFGAALDGQPVSGLESAKVKALLAHLAVESDRAHTRQALAGLLWPEFPEASARRNLRQALFNLRRSIGDDRAETPFLLADRETLRLNPEADLWIASL